MASSSSPLSSAERRTGSLGAIQMAQFVAEELQRIESPLAAYRKL
jgi:hypothetical protein